MNKIDNLTAVRDNKEGILSLSLPITFGRWDESEFFEIMDMCVEAGLNQLLPIMYEPQAFKTAEIAPAEIIVSKDGYLRGNYMDMTFPPTLHKIHQRYPDLPFIASFGPSEIVTYGVGRFLEKCKEFNIDTIDLAIYPAADDPLGLYKAIREAGLNYCCPLHAFSIDMKNPEHLVTFDNLVRLSYGELFLVTAIPTTELGFVGENFIPYVERIREKQKEYQNEDCKILSIGGIISPEDAYQLVRVAKTDGVHFSSKFINRLLQKEPLEKIQTWLKQVKDAMRG